jgi:biopolymer transport protein ExbD
MQIRRRKRLHAGVEASSLSDILFFLMLFFLMVSTLASQNALGLLLPESRTGKTMHQEVVNVSITLNKKYYMEGKEINFDQFKPMLTEKSAKAKNVTVVLRIDKNVSVEELIKAVDVINELHLHTVIATLKKE